MFRIGVNPLRDAVPAARKPGATIHGRPCNACVSPMGAPRKTSLFFAVRHVI